MEGAWKEFEDYLCDCIGTFRLLWASDEVSRMPTRLCGARVRNVLLGHDVQGVVVGPAAVVCEVIKNLHIQSAFQQVTNNRGVFEAESVSGSKRHRRRGRDVVRKDHAIDDSPVAGSGRAGAKTVNSDFIAIGGDDQADQAAGLVITVHPGSEDRCRRNYERNVGFGKSEARNLFLQDVAGSPKFELCDGWRHK